MEPNPETSIHSEPSTGVPTAAAHPETLSSVPEDLRTPWDWIDLVIFALLAVGGTFLISIALIFIFSAFGIRPAQIRTSPSRKKLFCHRKSGPRFIWSARLPGGANTPPRRKTILAHSWLAAIGDESCAEAGGLRAFSCWRPITFDVRPIFFGIFPAQRQIADRNFFSGSR